jgi:hypothetical protein
MDSILVGIYHFFRAGSTDSTQGTSEVRSFVVAMGQYEVHLVDTPGLGGSRQNNAEFLQGIASFLATVYEKQGNLSGILYLHQMTARCMTASARRNLAIFQQLIGDHCLMNCVLVTTKWSKVHKEVGKLREEELLNSPTLWKAMIAKGARVMRFDGTRESALEILHYIAGLRSIIVPRLTEELCIEGKKLGQTGAGQILKVDLEEVRLWS